MQETEEKTSDTEKHTEKELQVSRGAYQMDDQEDSRSLKKRYMDLWRVRKKKDKFKSAIFEPIIVGLGFMMMSPIFGVNIFNSTLLLVTGTLVGLAYSGYKNDTDGFIGFHLGAASFIPFSAAFLGYVMLTNPLMSVFIAPLVAFYTIVTGVSGATYAHLGKKVREE